MNNPKVNILMATYNGAKYIEAQLDSIMQQTYDNIDIYIRDDGSTDDTLQVIEAYRKNNTSSKKIILLDNGGKNLRCPESFYEIFRRCAPAKYYALCDQDDIWYPEKIAWAIERLEQEDEKQIQVYYTASDYCEEDGTLIRRSPQQKEKLQLTDVLYYTPGSGFTIVINEQARKHLILDVNPGKELHDRWLIRGGVCFGNVLYDQRATAKHIRHEAAVTAGDAGNINLLLHFLKNEIAGENAKKEKEALSFFQKAFADKLSKQQKNTLELFAKKANGWDWIRKVCYPKRLRRRLGGELALRFMFLIGKI